MRQRLEERLRDPVAWTTALQIVKTVVAAVASWLIAGTALVISAQARATAAS